MIDLAPRPGDTVTFPQRSIPLSSVRSILLIKLADALETENDSISTPTPPVLRMATLGTRSEIEQLLEPFNTAADGSSNGHGVLHGPGIIAQLPMVGDDEPISQLLVTLNDESAAWPVLERLCRVLGWKMMDPQSGRTFG